MTDKDQPPSNWRPFSEVFSEVIGRIGWAVSSADTPYQRYIRSDEWRERRAAVMRRCGGLCEGCHNARAIQVHHLTYCNLFDEPLSDLKALCNRCHELEHGILDSDPSLSIPAAATIPECPKIKKNSISPIQKQSKKVRR